MSLFLLVYDRSTGAADIRAEFPQDRADDAVRARFDVERQLAAGPPARAAATEVVVLSGESLDELRRTHARYFRSVHDLLAIPDSATSTDPRQDDDAP